MKKMFVIMLMLPFGVAAQSEQLPKDEKGNVYFSEVFEVPGKSVDQLFTSSKVFVAEAFKDANAVIKMDDRTSGILIGKGASKGQYKAIGTVITTLEYTFKISMKEGRYRVEYYDWTFGDAVTRLPVEMIFEPGKNKKNMDGMAGLIIDTVNRLNGNLAEQVSKKHDDW